MNKLLLLGTLCAGLSATTAAQAQLLGNIRNVVAPQPCDCNTGGTPRPSLGSLGLRESPLLNGPLGDAVDRALRIPLPGLDERIPGVVAIGDDVIVRVGGIVGPAPTPVIPIPELVSTLPGILSVGENVIVRVGGIVGPAPTPVIPIPILRPRNPA
jgi:hypothetical protein